MGKALLCLALGCAFAAVQFQPSGSHEAWLQARMTEATSVKPGATRADLLKIFEADGGLQRIPAARYVLITCHLIKVDVEFEPPEPPSADQPVPADADLKIATVSKPYLEYPAKD